LAAKIKRGNLCSLDSLDADEEMFGTATRADVWFLLEYRGRWSGSAYKDSKIPKAVKSHLNKALKSVPDSRLQLIKKHENKDETLKFFIAVSKEKNPRLYEFVLSDYDDLLSLDIKKCMKSKKHVSEGNIYIMCTNGEYDICCGKFGMPVYLDLANGAYGRNMWQTNHIGGHRFAATFVCLPHGIVYGRVREGSVAESLIEYYEQGKVNISRYRGRSCHVSEAQAAEYYLRKETGEAEISRFKFKNLKKKDKKSVIKFVSLPEKETHTVRIRQYKNSVKLSKSCGDKPSYIPQFRLLDLSKP
jgi:hypothetical protein